MMTNKMEACNVRNVASFHALYCHLYYYSPINPKQLTDIRQKQINSEYDDVNHQQLNNIHLYAVNACTRNGRHKRYACIHKFYRLHNNKA